MPFYQIFTTARLSSVEQPTLTTFHSFTEQTGLYAKASSVHKLALNTIPRIKHLIRCVRERFLAILFMFSWIREEEDLIVISLLLLLPILTQARIIQPHAQCPRDNIQIGSIQRVLCVSVGSAGTVLAAVKSFQEMLFSWKRNSNKLHSRC